MTVLYEPLARQELADAVAYYKAISPDLADRLLDAEEAAIRRIEQLPNAWPPLKGGLRRCILDVFPYQIIYRVEAETIRVFAFAHLSRRPHYWRSRL